MNNIDLSFFATEVLAQNCAEESSKKQVASRDDRFCFELLRRAFGLDDHSALGYVLNIYKDVWSRFWVHNTHVFDNQVVTVDDFKSIAFARVYQQLKGSAFDGFSSLTPLLAYMKVTLVRTVAAYLRSSASQQWRVNLTGDNDSDLLENLPADDNPRVESEKNVIRQEVDARILQLLPDENDRLLLDLSWSQNLSRADIVAAYPTIWESEDAVRVALQRIKRRLYKDPGLADLLKGLL